MPGGRQPAEVLREGTINLKLAERERLLAQAEAAERAAEAEAAKVAQLEEALAKRLEEVTGIKLALTEVPIIHDSTYTKAYLV